MRPVFAGHSRGFTLVELLVAITILALFMTASMGAVRIGSRSWAVGHERADTTEEMRASADFLRRQFAQLVPLTIGEGDRERIVFAADEQRTLFVAPAPQFANGAGLTTYLLEGEPLDDGKAELTLRFATYDPGSDAYEDTSFRDRIVLAHGLDTVRFEYYGTPDRQQRAAWRTAWPGDAEYFPAAIRIRTRSDGTRSGDGGWPDLVYALRGGGGP